MKLNVLRGFWASAVAIVFGVGIYFICDTIMLMLHATTSDQSYVINLAALIVGLVIVGYSFYTIIRSFRHGTVLLRQLAFNRFNRRSIWFLILTICLTVLSLLTIVWFSIEVCSSSPILFKSFNRSDNELFIFFGLLMLVEFGFALIYDLFFKLDDYSKN